jgi:hypothetical protein
MLFLQQAVSIGGWVGPTIAISLVIIAFSFVAIAFASAMAARQASGEFRRLAQVMESLRTDLAPALGAVAAVSNEGERLAGIIAGEAEELVSSSRALREGLQSRLQNLEAIYDVLEEEVEETALELAVTLRGVRSGVGWFGRIRRLLGLGRRR